MAMLPWIEGHAYQVPFDRTAALMAKLAALVAGKWHHARSSARRLPTDGAGATAIEYGLMLSGIAVFILVAVFAIGNELDNMFTAVQTKIVNSYT